MIMFDEWAQDLAAWQRQTHQEEADAHRQDAEAVRARRAELELAIAAEVRDTAARGGRGPGEQTTHDVALAIATVGYRFRYPVDHAEVEAVLTRDPEPVAVDYRPLRSAARRGLAR